MDTTLVTDIDAAIERTGISATAFGRALGDGHLVHQMRAGRRVWPETAEKIRAHIAKLEAERAA